MKRENLGNILNENYNYSSKNYSNELGKTNVKDPICTDNIQSSVQKLVQEKKGKWRTKLYRLCIYKRRV